MSQYVSRIHIKVSSPDIWTKFEEEDDAGFDLADLSKTNQTSFSISGDWSCVEDELTGIVKALSKTLEQDGIIIADTTNINVDPYDFCVYYFGGYVQVERFTIWDDRKKCEMFSETNIDDIAGWLSYGEFMVSSEEKEILFKHGITSIDGHYESFSTDLDLPSKIYLRETSFEGRDQIIEKSIIGEEVYFVHAKDSYDPMRLEVLSELGSLGYVPSDVSDQIAPTLFSERLEYTATISELVPASKRNKHAKSSIVAISINAYVTSKRVAPKKSVPKLNNREKMREEADLLAKKELASQEEERKRAEEAARLEEERKRAEEAARLEEERKRAEEAARLVEERKRAEEAARLEEERKRAEEAARLEAERKRVEEAARLEEERKRVEEAARLEEERKRAEDKAAKLKAELAAKEAYEKALSKYESDYSDWITACDKVRSERESYISKKLSEDKLQKKMDAEKQHNQAISSLQNELKEQENIIASAREFLSKLGLFKFSEKKEQKAIIEAAERKVEELKSAIEASDSSFKTLLEDIEKNAEAKKEQIKSAAEKKYPMPLKPTKPTAD